MFKGIGLPVSDDAQFQGLAGFKCCLDAPAETIPSRKMVKRRPSVLHRLAVCIDQPQPGLGVDAANARDRCFGLGAGGLHRFAGCSRCGEGQLVIVACGQNIPKTGILQLRIVIFGKILVKSASSSRII